MNTTFERETVIEYTTFNPNNRDYDDNIRNLAQYLHSELCGCDDKTCEYPSEIYYWLYEGDIWGMTIQELLSECFDLIFPRHRS